MYPLLGPITDPGWRRGVVGIALLIAPISLVVFFLGLERDGFVNTAIGAPVLFALLFEFTIQSARVVNPRVRQLWRDNAPLIHENPPLPRRLLVILVGVALGIAVVLGLVGPPPFPTFIILLAGFYVAAKFRARSAR